jgi:hypothetical protein
MAIYRKNSTMLQIAEKDFGTCKLGSYYAYLKSDHPLIDNYSGKIPAVITFNSGQSSRINLFIQLSKKPDSSTDHWEYCAII